MTNGMNPEELTPDPDLATALRALEGDPPLEAVDWPRLQHSLHERAELPLARRRARERRRAWLRPLVPLGAAASVALALWEGGGGRGEQAALRPDSTAVQTANLTPEEALGAAMSEQDYRLFVSGRSNPDQLLLIAVETR